MSTSPQGRPVTAEPIFGALNAYQLSAALRGAIELDLFTAIAEGVTDAAAIAERCQASERGCRILCDFLTVQGLLTKSDGKWGLTPESALFLDRRSPAYLGGTVRFLHTPELINASSDVAGLVRKGATLMGEEGTVSHDNRIWVDFARAMAPLVMPAAMEIAEIVAQDGAAPISVLDIAAGHGFFGIHIAKRNPQARITAVDWAAVLEVARENAQQAGVSDRLNTLAGSAFDVDFGKDHDIVLLTNFLHHFDRETCVTLLKKVRAALKPGGRAITLEFIPNPDRVSPPIHAAFSFMMLVSTRSGDAYTFAELESMFAEAGFASSEMRELRQSPERLVISKA